PALPLCDHTDVPLLRYVLPGDAPAARAARGRVRDAALARRRRVPPFDPRHGDIRRVGAARRLSAALGRRRCLGRTLRLPEGAHLVTTLALTRSRGHLLFERNLMVYRRAWMTIFSGFFEPLFYLFSLGLGLGHFVGKVHGVSYASYIAPALLASSAMNGALNEAMTNVFWKLRYMKIYDSVLATPLGPGDVAFGETVWAQFRGLLYTCGFLVTVAALGLIHSAWGILALPAAMVVAFSFAGIGIGASTFIRTWQDLDFVQLVQL